MGIDVGVHYSTNTRTYTRNSSLKSQVVLLQTAHSWANAGVLLGARMHRERGSFRSNLSIRMKLVREK